MAKFPLNFAQIESRSFPVYPPGRYTLRVLEARQEASKNSGELKETVIFEIVSGPGPSTEHSGKKIPASYSLQQKAGFRIERFLGACGIPKEAMGEVDDQQLVGCMIQANITVETWNGNNVNRVQGEDPIQQHAAAAPAPQGFVQAPAPQGFVQAPQAQAPFPTQWAPPPAPAIPSQFQGAAPLPPPAKPVR